MDARGAIFPPCAAASSIISFLLSFMTSSLDMFAFASPFIGFMPNSRCYLTLGDC